MIGHLISISEKQLQQFIEKPNLIEAYIHTVQNQSNRYLDLDKSWHAIHFMLNGNDYEGQGALASVFFGGEELKVDMGYGPVRYLTIGEVKQVSDKLSLISDDAFCRKYEPVAMDDASIYPNIWEQDGEDGLQYILPYYQDLKVFYREAALRDEAVLIYLS